MPNPNRRDLILAAGGLAAATTVATAAPGRALAAPHDRREQHIAAAQNNGASASMSIDGIGTFAIRSADFTDTADAPRSQGGGGSTSKADIGPMEVTKSIDEFSPPIFLTFVKGAHVKTATISITGPHGTPLITYELGEVVFGEVSHETKLPHGPTEMISLFYDTIRITVNGVSAGWNVSAQKAL